MEKRAQLLCINGALVFVALLSLGIFAVAGWFPPQRPYLGADEVAQIFRDDALRIRLGMTLLALGGVFWWPMSAAISSQLRRIPQVGHVFAATQLASAAGSALAVLFPAYVWLALAFRPGATSPDTLQLLNDFSWIAFVSMYPPGFIQNLAIAAAVLMDRSDKPVYPRWVGYASLLAAIDFVAGALVPFFTRGPFSWNGLIGFWMVATVFFGWVLMMWWMTRKAILAQPDAGS